jgi:hypothetical protein
MERFGGQGARNGHFSITIKIPRDPLNGKFMLAGALLL